MSADWQHHLDLHVQQLHPQLIGIRRHLHKHPELSGQEIETTRYIVDVLQAAHLRPRTGPAGRGAIVDGGTQSGETNAVRVAIRADIDALPIHEAGEKPFRSACDGVMHACGHDGHTAAVLGASLALAKMQEAEQLPCPIPWRALFQPAEETLVGAQEMTAAGALDGVGAVFSLHMDPSRSVGTIGVREGAFTANCDTLVITINGRGGHAARPHLTLDPIAAAAQLLSALYAQIPRRVDSQDAIVLSFGHIAAGEAANVIPDQARLLGTLRTLDAHVRRQAKADIERIVRAIAEATQTGIALAWGSGIGSVINDPAATQIVRQAGAEVVGPERVQEIGRASMGSEDFASYLEHVPGSMFRLGCASPAAGNSGLHTPTFDLDEESLAIGARILARAVIMWSLAKNGPVRK